MQSTYENIVGIRDHQRACVCCGTVARIRQLAENKVPRFNLSMTSTPLSHTFNNICDVIKAVDDDGSAETQTFIPVCIPCLHWVNHHAHCSARITFPVFYLFEFLRCLQTPDGLSFDRRTIWRLCKNLTTPFQGRINYYVIFFPPHMQAVMQRIAAQGTQSVGREVAQAFNDIHGDMLFAPSRRLSEFLRDTLINNDYNADDHE